MAGEDNNIAYSKRLDRIENKLDQISEALVEIARADERINSVETQMHNADRRISDNETRLRVVEIASAENTQAINNVIRLGYIVVTAVIVNMVYAIFSSGILSR